ncbi:MAG TPA: hypothetical protein DF637_04895 [Rikenellaceae bacterium]|nr:hypothetical protein [Rikenellaceae bacterium]
MKIKAVLLIAILSITSVAVFSQETCSKYSLKHRFSVELGGGHSRTVVKPGGFKVSEGMGADAIIGFNAYKNFGVYAGWGWNNFSNEHFDFEETGYMYGIQYKNAFKESKFSYTLRAGALYNHIEVEGAHDSDFDGFYYDSGHGLGFHSSGALEYSLGKGWGINATVKYHQLNRTVVLPDSELLPNPGETDYNIHLKYIGLRIGIVKNF